MTELPQPTQASVKELPDIQGGLVGFNKDLQTLLYVDFRSAQAGRAFLALLRLDDIDLIELNEAFAAQALAAAGRPG